MLLAFQGKSQFRGENNKVVGAEFLGGFILKHKPQIAHLITNHPVGFRVTFDRQTFGDKTWEQRFNFPDIGFTMIYIDYKNPIIGKSITVIPHYKIYLNKNRKSKNLVSYKIGLGAEYNTNKYDKETNNKNNLLSTDINVAAILEATYQREITKELFLRGSLSLTHFSNGSLKKPNSGINIVSANLGMAYNISYTPREYIYKEERAVEKTIGFTSTLSGGMHAFSRIGTGQHPFFTFTGVVDKRLNHKSAIGVGFDWFGSLSMKEDIKYDWRLADDPNTPSWMRVGVSLSHELFVSRLSIITQVGYYIFDEYDYFGKIYLRAGLRRYFSKHLYTSFSLKTHAAKAEAIEFGVGWRFK
ncbi:acyloxyacyl hydrolase [Fulvivirga sediminis]|uniref:Acyloxyacyl hydrolase n=1 Tax=Fulvivirga sediminis TaxID=2803949 RepID=A0A937K0D8_9BACT|nr:acyloxyacyl hydrolase [Fulvivirga sediminis]MBL3656216.1 acyloxyacyl hydrolase [Fulvivirga sediminis]